MIASIGRTANRCFATAGLLLLMIIGLGLSSAVARTQVGPIEVSTHSMGNFNASHGYIEYEVSLKNNSESDRHEVEIVYPAHSYNMNRNLIEKIRRRVVLGPASTATVNLLQPPLPLAMPNQNLRVTVYGEDPKEVPINAPTFDNYNNRNTAPNVLLSRSINQSDLENQLDKHIYPTPPKGSGRNQKKYQLIRAETPAKDWTENWLGYSCFDGIVLRAEDIRAMSGPIRNAIWQYVETGGNILVLGDFEPSRKMQNSDPHSSDASLKVWSISFGKCAVCPAEETGNWNKKTLSAINRQWKDTQAPWKSLEETGTMHNYFPVMENLGTPVRTIYVLIIIFAILIGPVSYFILARQDKRIAMIWLVPVLSLLASGGIFIYAILSEGITPHVRMQSITILDQRSHRSATLGLQGYYAPLAPRNGLQFGYQTELTPLVERSWHNGNGRTVDLTRNQHLESGWIKARVPAYFRIRKAEMRRERIDVSRKGDSLRIINGMGTDIAEIVLADKKGRLHRAENVAAGKEVEMQPMHKSARSSPSTLPHFYSHIQWHKMTEPDTFSPATTLLPNTYMAKTEGSPFLDNGLGNGTEKTKGLVYGHF